MRRLISFTLFLLLVMVAIWARSRAAQVSQPAGQRTAQAVPF